jgi:hypothetical protein
MVIKVWVQRAAVKVVAGFHRLAEKAVVLHNPVDPVMT